MLLQYSILLGRYGDLSSSEIRLYLERLGFRLSRPVQFRILMRLVQQNLCEVVRAERGARHRYKANNNTAAYCYLYIEDLEDFAAVLVDLRDGRRHAQWGGESLL